MSLFDGFKKKIGNNRDKVSTNFTVSANNSVINTASKDYFKGGDKAIINSISSNMILVLRMLYIAYKNDGNITMSDVQKNPTYYENKEFENLLIALGKTKTIDCSKTYLQLAQEFMSPPANLSNEETIVFRYANDILASNNANCEEFEAFVNSKIAETNKDFSGIIPQKSTIEYKCPLGQASAQDMKKYDKALKQTIENAAIDAGISNWFRSYKELTLFGFEYAKRIFRNGQAVTDLMKLPSMKGKANQAFAVLCGYVLNAGIVSAKEYCTSKGNVETVKVKLTSMTNEQIADSAAKLFGFEAGNDKGFLMTLSPISISVAEFVANNKENPTFFMNSMLISLKTVFEFGTGLYFER